MKVVYGSRPGQRVDAEEFEFMIIPYHELSEQTLQALIEDFVTRDGTDYGWDELSMQEKARKLLALLETGELLISYNEASQTCGLVSREQSTK